MFFDLNVLLPVPALVSAASGQGKGGKQGQKEQHPGLLPCLYTPGQIAAIDRRIDILVHLGYTVLALNQSTPSKVDLRTHVNWIDGLLPKLKQRQGVMLLKRLTVMLDEESEKALGLNPQNVPILHQYDILSLRPTTLATFSLACLQHSAPSQHTAHIISIPVTFPRLPFYLKHTLVRMALKNGAVFEIDYAGAVGQEGDRRHWWGGAREVARVTKGRGILVSSGTEEDACLRAPRDVANLITLVGLGQHLSHDAVSRTPKSVILRAQSRKTYRSVLSEPKLVIPAGFSASHPFAGVSTETAGKTAPTPVDASSNTVPGSLRPTPTPIPSKKRLHDGDVSRGGERSRKKKKKKVDV